MLSFDVREITAFVEEIGKKIVFDPAKTEELSDYEKGKNDVYKDISSLLSEMILKKIQEVELPDFNDDFEVPENYK